MHADVTRSFERHARRFADAADSLDHARLSPYERFRFDRAVFAGSKRVALHFLGSEATHVSTWLTLPEAERLARGEDVPDAFFDVGMHMLLGGEAARASLAVETLLRGAP